MRNLIAFFRRFRIFLVFLILQILALTSYFSWVQYPRTRFFNSSNGMVASFLDAQQDVTKHFSLEAENARLQEEIKALKHKQLENFIAISEDRIRVEDTLLELQFDYIPAVIVNSTYTYKNNYFTLNKGASSGVKRDMGVVSSNGVVGIVYDVSNHYSVIQSVLTENINIPAEISKIHAGGLIKWHDNGRDPRTVILTGISNDIPVELGWEVVTNSQSGLFPKNHPVGKIVKVEEIEGKPEWKITIELGNDLRQLQSVLVVENILKLEKDSLEGVFLDEFGD